MFDPLPGLMRLRRDQRNLSLQQLATMAEISYGMLWEFENGQQNITLALLLRIAQVLEMSALPVGNLDPRPSAADDATLTAAADACAAAERVVTQVVSVAEELQSASASIRNLLDGMLAAPPGRG